MYAKELRITIENYLFLLSGRYFFEENLTCVAGIPFPFPFKRLPCRLKKI